MEIRKNGPMGKRKLDISNGIWGKKNFGKYGNLEECKFGKIQTCKYANLEKGNKEKQKLRKMERLSLSVAKSAISIFVT